MLFRSPIRTSDAGDNGEGWEDEEAAVAQAAKVGLELDLLPLE